VHDVRIAGDVDVDRKSPAVESGAVRKPPIDEIPSFAGRRRPDIRYSSSIRASASPSLTRNSWRAPFRMLWPRNVPAVSDAT